MNDVDVVMPAGVDDPTQPSGGNTYDRQVCGELSALGFSVREHAVHGCWPNPDAASLVALAVLLANIPPGAVVLIDGLIASAAPEALLPHAGRLRVVVLVHMPLGHRPRTGDPGGTRRREYAVLHAAAGVVTTSAWTRRRLLELYSLPRDRVHIAAPGVDAAELAIGTAAGSALLCVAAVTFDKGHDVLLDALEGVSGLPWRCTCVGSLDRDPAFVDGLRRQPRVGALGGERVSFVGPLTGADLDREYAAADLVILASRAETYGMVVTEALARGLPVLATDVGGVSEALGHTTGGRRPGLLVPPDDPLAFGAALRAWLGDVTLRDRLRQAARGRRESLSRWSTTASLLAAVLMRVSR